jgi:hypothetical protein
MLRGLFGSDSVLLLLPATCEDLIKSVLKDVSVVIQQPFLVVGIRVFDDRYETQVSDMSSACCAQVRRSTLGLTCSSPSDIS